MYVRKKYNPSSRIKRRGEIRKQVAFGMKIILPIILIMVGVLVMRSSFMQIKNIEVVGSVQTEDVKQIAAATLSGNKMLLFPKTNTLLISKNNLKEKILKTFPKIEDASISYDLGGVLKIDVTERVGEMLWCSDVECYLMSNAGLVFAKASPDDMIGKIRFEGSIMGDPILQEFASGGSMQNYLDVISTINASSIQVEKVIEELPNKANIITSSGTIILNPEENMSDAAKNAILLISEIKAKDPATKLEYVDARYGKKMFYKIEGKSEKS